jgi:uncharacterized membrane protein
MNRKCWFIPALIVVINAVAITMCWTSLPEVVPAHFDLQGNAGGSMSRSILMLYPMIGAAVCLAAYMIARKKHELQTGLVILTSGLSLVLLSSTMVTLTSGTMPIFMLAEPVILLAAVVGFVFCIVKSRKKISDRADVRNR